MAERAIVCTFAPRHALCMYVCVRAYVCVCVCVCVCICPRSATYVTNVRYSLGESRVCYVKSAVTLRVWHYVTECASVGEHATDGRSLARRTCKRHRNAIPACSVERENVSFAFFLFFFFAGRCLIFIERLRTTRLREILPSASLGFAWSRFPGSLIELSRCKLLDLNTNASTVGDSMNFLSRDIPRSGIRWPKLLNDNVKPI